MRSEEYIKDTSPTENLISAPALAANFEGIDSQETILQSPPHSQILNYQNTFLQISPYYIGCRSHGNTISSPSHRFRNRPSICLNQRQRLDYGSDWPPNDRRWLPTQSRHQPCLTYQPDLIQSVLGRHDPHGRPNHRRSIALRLTSDWPRAYHTRQHGLLPRRRHQQLHDQRSQSPIGKRHHYALGLWPASGPYHIFFNFLALNTASSREIALYVFNQTTDAYGAWQYEQVVRGLRDFLL
jgi:hypothetical protein